jgi:anti-sigma factor RsiW
LNCSKIQNLLSAYMDGELTGVEQLQIRRHLGECKACAEEHESLLTTKRMISGLSIRQPHPDLEQMILGALAEEEQSRARRSPILAWWLTLPLNRRLQFACLFALSAVSLAAVRIAPVMLTPARTQNTLELAAEMTAPQPHVHTHIQTEVSPVGDVIFLHNPAENAPMSSGARAMPVNMTDFNENGLR